MFVGFPSDVRLKKGWQFDLVFRTGRREKGALVRLFFVKAEGVHTQVGVAVGRKVANSVGRSRGKRVLRESLRRLLPHVKDGYQMVVSLRETGLGVNAKLIYRDLSRLFVRCDLIKQDESVPLWQ